MSNTFIVYVSTRNDTVDKNLVRDIAIESSRNNHQKNVTGVLMGIGGYFVQVLEGDEKVLEDLLALIEQDQRHSNLKILYKGTLSDRLFGRWSMGCVDVENAAECDTQRFEKIGEEIELLCQQENCSNSEKLKELIAEIPELLVLDPEKP